MRTQIKPGIVDCVTGMSPSGARIVLALLPEPPDPRSPSGERPPFQGGNVSPLRGRNVPNEDDKKVHMSLRRFTKLITPGQLAPIRTQAKHEIQIVDCVAASDVFAPFGGKLRLNMATRTPRSALP